jgi:hypothetical protein
MGAELSRPHLLALLAEVYGKVGQAEEGLTLLTEALAAIEKNGERYYEAELYRLKGQLVLQSGVRSPKSKQVSGKSKTNLKQVKTSPEFGVRSQKLRNVFRKRLKSRVSSKRSRWNCAQQRVLPASGNDKESNTKHATYYLRSTAGSLKGLTPPTCKRPRRCSKNWRGGKVRSYAPTGLCPVFRFPF